MQLDLFGTPQESLPKPAVAPADFSPALTAIAQHLPDQIYLGTSSWAFAGWRGLVFAHDALKTKLARHGLAAYAQHPLLRSVGLDRTYYAPITTSDFRDYAAMVPDDFQFLVKAHELCTLPVFRGGGRYPQRKGEANASFLDPHYATDCVVGPYVEGLQTKAGTLLFQFPPLSAAAVGGPQRFAERLHAFLDGLEPRGIRYAVELRNRDLFTSAYVDALVATDAVHCFNVHPTMPPILEQVVTAQAAAARALVVRWMLHPGHGYEGARRRYEPFDRLVDEDPEHRQAIAQLCLNAVASSRPAMIIVNNKAEGSSPLTIQKLAEALVPMQ